MNNLQLTPRHLHTQGVEKMFQEWDRLRALAPINGYPPFNLLKNGEDDFQIEVALAGFRPEEVTVVQKERNVTIKGSPKVEEEKNTLIHRGIARRSFVRNFVLADHVQVEGASMRDGMLTVSLKHVVPESAKPRQIAIQGVSNVETLAA